MYGAGIAARMQIFKVEYSIKPMRKLIIAVLLTTLTGPTAEAQQTGLQTLLLPLDCINGPTCFVQNMVDMDTGKKHRDAFCGSATYDGHKGTDFRVRRLSDMKKDVPVRAMADGKVLRSRNNLRDRLVETDADRAAINGRECGNGLVVDHTGNGVKTVEVQYCHLARGSVRVRPGDVVKRGDVVGRIGLSGDTQFPHVHVSLRIDGTLVDPFTGLRQGDACSPNDKQNDRQSGLQKSLFQEVPEGLFNPFLEAGFSNGPVKGKAVLKGLTGKPDRAGPLVFYAKFINLKKGDTIRLLIDGPDGPFADTTTKPLDRPKATYTAFTGKRGTLAPGTYLGKAALIRGGKVIFQGDPVAIQF